MGRHIRIEAAPKGKAFHKPVEGGDLQQRRCQGMHAVQNRQAVAAGRIKAGCEHIRPLPRQARRTVARASRTAIEAPDELPSWVLLHELAHALTSTAEEKSDGHGPRFTGMYLRLLERYAGAARLFRVEITQEEDSGHPSGKRLAMKTHQREDLKEWAESSDGCYLLRTNLTDTDPAQLWQHYLQLVQVEQAFKNLKGDLAIRPIFHKHDTRIEAHIFIAFLAYCLHVTLARRLHALAPGLTARRALEKFAAVQMIDVHLPTTDGREIVLTRYTQPEPDLKLLIDQLKLRLPPQAPPRITSADLLPATRL